MSIDICWSQILRLAFLENIQTQFAKNHHMEICNNQVDETQFAKNHQMEICNNQVDDIYYNNRPLLRGKFFGDACLSFLYRHSLDFQQN